MLVLAVILLFEPPKNIPNNEKIPQNAPSFVN